MLHCYMLSCCIDVCSIVATDNFKPLTHHVADVPEMVQSYFADMLLFICCIVLLIYVVLMYVVMLYVVLLY